MPHSLESSPISSGLISQSTASVDAVREEICTIIAALLHDRESQTAHRSTQLAGGLDSYYAVSLSFFTTESCQSVAVRLELFALKSRTQICTYNEDNYQEGSIGTYRQGEIIDVNWLKSLLYAAVNVSRA